MEFVAAISQEFERASSLMQFCASGGFVGRSYRCMDMGNTDRNVRETLQGGAIYYLAMGHACIRLAQPIVRGTIIKRSNVFDIHPFSDLLTKTNERKERK